MASAVRDFTMTLDGSAQNVGAYLATATLLTARDDGNWQQIIITSPAGNSSVYVGGSSAVDSTSYGYLLAASGQLNLGPLSLSAIHLRDLWVKGTNAEKIHILAVQL